VFQQVAFAYAAISRGPFQGTAWQIKRVPRGTLNGIRVAPLEGSAWHRPGCQACELKGCLLAKRCELSP